MIIAIDFDGTIVEHDFPRIGKAVPLAIETIKELKRLGHKIILYTMRSGVFLRAAVSWCKDNGLEFWGINKNPDQKKWTSSPKVFADLYIDDSAYRVPLIRQDGKFHFVDWSEVLYYVKNCGHVKKVSELSGEDEK